MYELSLMILHVQTFWKAIIAWFSTNNIIPLASYCAWAHLFRRRPKFNNPLSPLAHALRLFLNSQMLIRDKLATFPSSTSTVSALLTVLCCLYVCCTSIPFYWCGCCFFNGKTQTQGCFSSMTNRFKSILPKWFLCVVWSSKKCSFQIASILLLLLLRGSAVYSRAWNGKKRSPNEGAF